MTRISGGGGGTRVSNQRTNLCGTFGKGRGEGRGETAPKGRLRKEAQGNLNEKARLFSG